MINFCTKVVAGRRRKTANKGSVSLLMTASRFHRHHQPTRIPLRHKNPELVAVRHQQQQLKSPSHIIYLGGSHELSAWKGAKDKVNRPKGPPARRPLDLYVVSDIWVSECYALHGNSGHRMYLPLWKGDCLCKRYISANKKKRAPVILVLQLNIVPITSALWTGTHLFNTMSATPTKTAVASKLSHCCKIRANNIFEEKKYYKWKQQQLPCDICLFPGPTRRIASATIGNVWPKPGSVIRSMKQYQTSISSHRTPPLPKETFLTSDQWSLTTGPPIHSHKHPYTWPIFLSH